MSFQNVYNTNGILDWNFDNGSNVIKTIAKSNSVTTENELIFLLTTGGTTDIVINENGITGSFYVSQDQFGNPISNNVTSLATQITIPAQESELRDLELICMSSLQSIRSRFGVTDLACVAYTQNTSLFVDVLIGVNKDEVEEYQIQLWTKINGLS